MPPPSSHSNPSASSVAVATVVAAAVGAAAVRWYGPGRRRRGTASDATDGDGDDGAAEGGASGGGADRGSEDSDDNDAPTGGADRIARGGASASGDGRGEAAAEVEAGKQECGRGSDDDGNGGEGWEVVDVDPEEEAEQLNDAMKRRDRDAIRNILRARERRQRGEGRSGGGNGNGDAAASEGGPDSSPPPLRGALSAASDSAAVFDPQDFNCPICRQLLHKPCVNTCGHAFCFWCLHASMSYVGSSECPVCRNPFTQFASVFAPLHRFLSREFPEEMGRRDEEVQADEADKWRGTRSPEVESGTAEDDDGEWMAGSVDVRDLQCVGCQGLVSEPVVPACGHLVCRGCVLERDDGEGGERHRECPECHTPITDGVGGRTGELAVCTILAPLLGHAQTMDPSKLSLALESRSATVAAPVMEEGSNSFMMVDGEADVVLDDDVDSQSGTALTAPRPDHDNTHVHFGIGCDGCGVYPIVGRAYRCLECPEEIGFDLCCDCIFRDVHRTATTGRFRQTHHPSHRMTERPQERMLLHALMQAHPELTPRQIMSFVEMHTEVIDGAEMERDNEES